VTVADSRLAADGLTAHSGALVIDGTCPGEHWREAFPSWIAGGASACVVSVAAWESCRNKKHAKAVWQFTTTDARIKLKRLYPAL